MLKIREFSKLCKCSVYTLRYYDEKQLNDYIEIKDFQSIGFSILEIQSFNSKTNNEILQMIDEKVEQLETKLELSIYIKKKYFVG